MMGFIVKKAVASVRLFAIEKYPKASVGYLELTLYL